MLNNIRELRLRLGLSIQDLANRSNVSKSVISDIERFRKIPTQITIIKISMGFGLPVQCVFNFHLHDTDIEYYL